MKKLIYSFFAVIVLLIAVLIYNQLKLEEVEVALNSDYLVAPGIKMTASSETLDHVSPRFYELGHKYRQPH